MVREFTYNEKDIADGKMEISKLEDDKKKQYVSVDNKRYFTKCDQKETVIHSIDAHKLIIDECFIFLLSTFQNK